MEVHKYLPVDSILWARLLVSVVFVCFIAGETVWVIVESGKVNQGN